MIREIDSIKFERLIFEVERKILKIVSELQDTFSKLEEARGNIPDNKELQN